MCVPNCFKASVAQHDFQPGDTLYETPKAYSVWHTALQHIGFSVQVDSAVRGRDGSITFTVFRPNQDRTALVRATTIQTTQASFIALLRSGDFDSFPNSETV